MRFDDPQMLHLLWLVPASAVLFWFTARRKRALLERFAGRKLVARLARPLLPGGRAVRTMLLLGALAMLIVALARPQYGKEAVILQREGRDLVFLLDTSLSMLADDIQPDRLSRARFEISSLLDRMQGDRVSLVPFAGDAFVLCPLTTDYSAVRLFLDGVDTEIISEPGTNLARALEVGGSAFDAKEREYRVMILITDGEELEGDALAAAAGIREQGVRLYAIGIGTPDGVPIPVRDERGEVTDYKRDERGEVVMTRLGEQLLAELAHAGGGEYYRAGRSAIELERIFEDINRLEKRQLESKEFTLYKDRYQWFLGAALLLMALEVMVIETGRRRRGDEQEGGEI
ncbi:MAG: VWA domain-containing protein [Candidatus Glassbacteria bacterium]|nr:VWA domain-containing protein [Candidatus Glassbacteria bacterium]